MARSEAQKVARAKYVKYKRQQAAAAKRGMSMPDYQQWLKDEAEAKVARFDNLEYSNMYDAGGALTDREDKKAHGWNWRAAYRMLIGDGPVCSPGDHGEAERYLRKIDQAIAAGESGGTKVYTKSEWGRLYRLQEKWRKRADGEDAVFEVRGNRGGKVTEEEKLAINKMKVAIEIVQISRGSYLHDLAQQQHKDKQRDNRG